MDKLYHFCTSIVRPLANRAQDVTTEALLDCFIEGLKTKIH